MRRFNLFNNKKTRLIAINTLLQAKSNLEDSIKSKITSLSSIFKKNDDNLLQTELESLKNNEEQLINYKLAQQEANLQKHTDGKSNFYYIYKKSNLEKRRVGLEEIKKKKISNVLKQKVDKLLVGIEKEIQVIVPKLTKFNNNNKINVSLVEGLNLL